MLRKLAALVAIKRIVDRNFRGRGRRTGTAGGTRGAVNRNARPGVRRKTWGFR